MSMRSQIRALFRRGVHVAASGAIGALQRLQVTVGDVLEDDVEHAQPYGLHTRPPAGSPVFLASLGGETAAPVALVVGDTLTRPTLTTDSDVVLYNAAGQQVRLTSTATLLGSAAATLGVARLTDTVAVTVPANAFGSGIPPAPVVVPGVINSGSLTVRSA